MKKILQAVLARTAPVLLAWRKMRFGCSKTIFMRALKFASVLGIVVIIVLAAKTLLRHIGFSDLEHLADLALPYVLLVFIVAAAIPFVPGAEIGFALLMVFGAEVVVEVYLSMLCALLLAFGAGRLVPSTSASRAVSSFVARWRLFRMRSRHAARERLTAKAVRVFQKISKNRHVALCAALNTPGNSILGGGGGLAFMAGASGCFSLLGFGVTASIAVLPVPLLFFVVGAA